MDKKYVQAMKIGSLASKIMPKIKDNRIYGFRLNQEEAEIATEIILEDWEIDECNVRKAIERMMDKGTRRYHDWDVYARGYTAGFMLGYPNIETLNQSMIAEMIWKTGLYVDYQDIFIKIINKEGF